MNQITYLTCSPLLIGRDVGDLQKPHHGSIASDPMPYISNDMINTDNNPFFDQSYCSCQTEQFKNSAFHFLMTLNVVSSDIMTTRSSAISKGGICYFNNIGYTVYMEYETHSIDIKEKIYTYRYHVLCSTVLLQKVHYFPIRWILNYIQCN
jgi:hypothetical protein